MNPGTIIRRMVEHQRMIQNLVDKIHDKTTTDADTLLILKHSDEIKEEMLKQDRWNELNSSTKSSLRYNKC